MAFLWLSLLTGCQKEKSGSALDDTPGKHTDQPLTIAFSPTTLPISQVDSVVVDLISPNGAAYHHLTLQKMGDRFASTSRVPEMGYEAYVIIYLRQENNKAYALLYHQLYGGGEEFIHKAAPKALADEQGWRLMGRVFSREEEFFALVGVAPSNPLVYLSMNPQKRNYIFIDKSYIYKGQPVSGGQFEYTAPATLAHPVAIKNAFAATASNMDGKAWSVFSSMTMAMNEQTGQENLFYFEHAQ